MTISKIYYQRNFRIGDFQYETIGIGIDINEGENAHEALEEAKRLVIEYNAEQNHPVPHIQESTVPQPLPEIQVDKVKDISLTEQICFAENIGELKQFELLAKMNPNLQKAYDNTYRLLIGKEE